MERYESGRYPDPYPPTEIEDHPGIRKRVRSRRIGNPRNPGNSIAEIIQNVGAVVVILAAIFDEIRHYFL
jgi:hypothetical protein